MEAVQTFLTAYGQYVWMAVSLGVAALLHYAVVRGQLEICQPASAYVFQIGRAAAFVAVVSWLAFFHAVWFPQYVGGGEGPPSFIAALEYAVGALFLVACFVGVPRAPRSRVTTDA